MKNPNFIARMVAIRQWFKAYKAACVCAHCGKTTGIEFHHVGEKKMKVSALVRVAHSIEEIMDEIRQCTPLCSSCHKKEHERLKNALH